MDGNVIIKAVLDTVDVSKNIKALERDLQGISWKNITEGDEKAAKLSSSFKKAGTAATVTLTAPVVAAGKAVFGVASDYEQANARIAAAFGVSGEEAERFSGIGKRIYEGGWGQSLDEVNDALIQCKSTLRDVSDEDLQTVTTNALMLSDTFGADVNESIRGTNALMEGFGLSATEASDLLTAGMQRGLNYTDELGDNLSEYSVRWGEAGMSASEYFSLLEAGTSNGAYNLDKVGDYLNEFLTALSDGRMEESIGSFSEGTQEVFENFKNGSATAEDMLQAVLGDLTQMPNEYDKAALASTLWSSLGEDNAMGMIESLAGVQDSFGDVAGAAQQAQEAASDSFAVKSQEAMRELQGSIEPLGEPLLNIATNVAGVVKSFSEWFAGIGEGGQTAVLAIATIAAAIGPVLSTVGTVVDTVPKIGAAFQVVGKLGTGALGLIAAHPVIAAIAAIIAAVEQLRGVPRRGDRRVGCRVRRVRGGHPSGGRRGPKRRRVLLAARRDAGRRVGRHLLHGAGGHRRHSRVLPRPGRHRLVHLGRHLQRGAGRRDAAGRDSEPGHRDAAHTLELHLGELRRAADGGMGRNLQRGGKLHRRGEPGHHRRGDGALRMVGRDVGRHQRHRQRHMGGHLRRGERIHPVR